MKSTLAAEWLNTENDVLDPERTTTSLLARVRPASKLTALAFGFPTSDGKTTSSPAAPAFVMVRFAEIATAPEGMPQAPATVNERAAPG